MLTPSNFKFNAMVKFTHKSNRTLELSRVFSFFVLINFSCIFTCKHKQVRYFFVSLCYGVQVVSNTSYSFNLLVSRVIKTLVPQAFAGFCVYRIYTPPLLIAINTFLLITLNCLNHVQYSN